MAMAVVAFPYARLEGTGRWMKDQAGWQQAILAGVTVLVTAAVAARWLGLAAVALAAVATGAGALFVLRRLPGFTGDVYGALCVQLETLTLLTFVAGERL
jgi:adenosylcobinamide-GDP ribazoletransferase